MTKLQTRLDFANVSLALFVSSLLCVGFYCEPLHEPQPAWVLLLIGWLGVFTGYFAWLANPAFLLAWLLRRSKPEASLALAVAALAFALSFLIHKRIPTNENSGTSSITAYGWGYYLWVLSIVIFITGYFREYLFSRNLIRSARFANTIGVGFSALLSIAFLMHFLNENGPFQLTREAERSFQTLCSSAGEKIFETPQDVKSVYLEPDIAQYFENIVKGAYGGEGGGSIGDIFLFQGRLLYIEVKNPGQEKVSTAPPYLKYGSNDRDSEPESELTSDYGVFQKSAVPDEVEKRLGIRGKEVVIKNLKTGHATATLTYFTNTRGRTICGQSGDGRFDVGDFVKKALNLTQRFPVVKAQEIRK